MKKPIVYSDGTQAYRKPELPRKGDRIRIRLKVFPDTMFQSLHLRVFQFGQSKLIRLHKSRSSKLSGYYECHIVLEDDFASYSFLIQDKEGIEWSYDRSGVQRFPGPVESQFVILDSKTIPHSYYGRNFYQIFPDRFCNANPQINPKNGERTYRGNPVLFRNWTQKPLEYPQGKCLDFFGGDLAGICSKLDYLQELGIDGIYLNPVFKAATHHRYDCEDYFKIDPYLGDNSDLIKLRQEMNSREMKLILDVSINHVGSSHYWFNQEGYYDGEGAWQNPKGYNSRYFLKRDGKFHYWEGVDNLLTLDFQNEDLRKRMYADHDSVVQTWLKEPFKTDGWRFDVAHCMAREHGGRDYEWVWREIRERIKAIDPQNYILAEYWDDPWPMLRGDRWDAVMNYAASARPIRRLLGERDWFLKHMLGPSKSLQSFTASDFIEQCKRVLCKIPYQLLHIQYNLINSHDVHRFYTLPGVTQEQHKAVSALLFCLTGIPSIYYGDEIELEGHTKSNEGCRYPFVWDPDPRSVEMYSNYQVLCSLRHNHESLKSGGFDLSENNECIRLLRIHPKDSLLLIINPTDKIQTVRIDDIQGYEVQASIILNSWGYKILSSYKDTTQYLSGVF